MTISTTESEISYATDGSTTSFPIPFVFDSVDDLKVVLTDEDGNVTEVTSGFSTTGGNGSTGTLVFNSAPASGYTLTIIDDPAEEQTIDYVSNDAFPAETNERGLDYLTRLLKRLSKRVDRTLRTRDGDPVSDLTLGSVDNRKGKFLFFNAITGAIEYATTLASETLSQSIIGQFLTPQTDAETAAGVTPPALHIPPRTIIPGSIERFLSPAHGNDITLALADAMAVSAQNKQDIIIPPGEWIISDECGFPNQYAIRGVGRGSHILLDLTAGQWAFKYSAGGSLQTWGFEGLYFDVVPGSSQDVGAIAITSGSTLRSAFIRHLYSDNLHRLIQMDDVFGSLFLEDWSCKLSHLLSDGVTSAVEPTAGNIAVDLAHGTANAVYARGLEILGFYRTAVKHTGRVFVLRDWNIAGSVTGQSELECAVHLYNSRNFHVCDGYSEKIRSQSSAFEGHATGNGSATTIIVEHDDVGSAALTGCIENINFATGSLYVLDAEEIEVENLAFAEANGGIRCGSGSGAAFADIRGGSVRAKRSALKVQPNSCGFIEIIDGNNSGNGYEPNPQLGSWATAPFSNISAATQSSETTDFLSGDRSVKVTCTQQFDGVTYTCTLPKASIVCTVVAKVKALTTGADVRMDATGNTTQSTSGCNRFKTSAVDEWQTLAITCSSSTTSVQVRIRNGLDDAAEFLIDSINVFPGVSSFDPSQCVAPVGSAYTATNVSTDRAYDADTVAVAELADVVGTLIADLKAGKLPR